MKTDSEERASGEDPVEQYPKPPYPSQEQEMPGSEQVMNLNLIMGKRPTKEAEN